MKVKLLFIPLLAGLVWLFVAQCTLNEKIDPSLAPTINEYLPELLSATYVTDSIFSAYNKTDSLYYLVEAATVADIDTAIFDIKKIAAKFGRHVVLLWNAPTDISTDSLYQFNVYRSTRSHDPDSLGRVAGVMDTIETATDINYSVIVPPATFFVDVDIVPQPVADITYYYSVTAVKLNWYEGKQSNEKTVKIPHDSTAVTP